MQRRSLVIHSPHSGRSAQLAEVLTYVQQVGVEVVESISIVDLDQLPAQGTAWREQGIDLVIAAGGDGLVGGVIAHIAESGLPLGILPLGTANDIARSLRLPQDLHRAAEVIAQGKEQDVDVGVARAVGQSSPDASQKPGFFAHALTAGLNVEFARIATNVATRKRFGRLTYPVAAIEVLKHHEALEVELHFEGLFFPPAHGFVHQHATSTSTPTDEETVLRCRALQVTVINAPIFGGQWQFAVPWASVSDRLLDIIVIEEAETVDLNRRLAYFFGSKEQSSDEQDQYPTRHPAELTGFPGIHHLQAQGVTVTTSADPCDVTLDGEIRGQTPMHVRVAEEPLRVVVPV